MIGRTKADSVELDEGVMPATSHVSRTVVEEDGEELKIFRRNGVKDIARVALAIGFRPSAGVGGWLVAVGVLALFVLALSWLSATIGIIAGSPEAANGFTFFVSFLAYPSSAFVPVDTMPSWLRGFARDQPVNTVVETTRAALTGGPVGSVAWHAVLWSLGIIAASVVASGMLFNRRS